MGKPYLNQPEILKFYKSLVMGLFIPNYIWRADFQFNKTLKRLIRQFSIAQAQYSIIPSRQHYSPLNLQEFSSIKRLQNMTFLYDRSGVARAQI